MFLRPRRLDAGQSGALVRAQGSRHPSLPRPAVRAITSLAPSACRSLPGTFEELGEADHLFLVVRGQVPRGTKQRLGRLVLHGLAGSVVAVEELDRALVEAGEVAQLQA